MRCGCFLKAVNQSNISNHEKGNTKTKTISDVSNPAIVLVHRSKRYVPIAIEISNRSKSFEEYAADVIVCPNQSVVKKELLI